jgi:hypothetical protein
VDRVPRLIRKAPAPIGLYLRVARNDHLSLQTYLAASASGISGLVFDATLVERQRELLSFAIDRRIDVVLDPRTQPLATIGGYSVALGQLPWGFGRINTLADYSGERGEEAIDAIAEFVIKNGFSQVISPSHVIADGEDEWLDVDIRSAFRLRETLDRRRRGDIPIIYSLATSYATFRNRTKLQAIVDRLSVTAVDAVWLNVDGFGSTSTAAGTVKYIDAARSFHKLNVPVIADHVGGFVGLALVSFGAVGGIAHGVTMGERFSTATWRKPPSNEKRFSPTHRVLVPSLDMMLSRDEAERIFETGAKAKAVFGCRDSSCCPRGPEDMVSKRARHFLFQRSREIGRLSAIPESIRAGRFLEEHLRPASDRALLASRVPLPKALSDKVSKQRERLDDLRVVLGEYELSRVAPTYSKLPLTFSARQLAHP